MLKSVGYAVLWLVGSGVAVAVAWAGVGVVDDEIITPAPAVTGTAPAVSGELASEELTESDRGERTTSTTTEPRASTTDSEPVSDPRITGSSTTVRGQSRSSSTAPPASSATSERPATTATTTGTTATTTQPTTSTTQATTTPTTPSTTTTPPTTSAVQTRTFQLTGGSTAISFSPGEIRVLWATPNPGFDVKIDQESPGMKVEFKAEHHESRIDAWWAGGPQHEIREKDRS